MQRAELVVSARASAFLKVTGSNWDRSHAEWREIICDEGYNMFVWQLGKTDVLEVVVFNTGPSSGLFVELLVTNKSTWRELWSKLSVLWVFEYWGPVGESPACVCVCVCVCLCVWESHLQSDRRDKRVYKHQVKRLVRMDQKGRNPATTIETFYPPHWLDDL